MKRLLTAVRRPALVAAALGATTSLACDGGALVDPRTAADTVLIEPATVTLHSLIDTVRLRASVRDAMGDPLPRAIVWASSNPSIASVDSSGLVRAVSRGVTRVFAATTGVGGSAPVTVRAPTVLLSPATLTLPAPGDTARVTGTVISASGVPTSGRIMWSSTAPAVATVNDRGLVTAVAEGVTDVIGSHVGSADTTRVTVGSGG